MSKYDETGNTSRESKINRLENTKKTPLCQSQTILMKYQRVLFVHIVKQDHQRIGLSSI